MTILQRIAREPNAVIGLIVGAYGVLVAFHVLSLTAGQVGAFTTLGGAVVFLLRWVTTPSAEVVAQRTPGHAVAVAGPASPIADGSAVSVTALQ